MDPHDSADPRPPVNETTGYSNAKPTEGKGRKVTTEHATGAGTITGHDKDTKDTRERERDRDKAEERDRDKAEERDRDKAEERDRDKGR